MTDCLSDEFFEQVRDELEQRVNAERFRHSVNVSAMAVDLARIYGVNEDHARLAGILHDWDKGYTKKEIALRARELNVDAPDMVYDLMPRILHAQTAAVALAQEYPELPAEVLQSIERHTQAAVGMSDLDMVIYIADALEPARDFTGLDEIRSQIGNVSLEELFFIVMADILKSLFIYNKTVNPISVDVWNHYVVRHNDLKATKGNL